MIFTNIFIYGDSVAFGKYDTRGGWEALLKDYFDKESISTKPDRYFTIFNLSIPGDGVSKLLKRFDFETQQRLHTDTSNIFIFALGLNDNLVNKSTFIGHLKTL